MESSKILFCYSKFQWARHRISSKYKDNWGQRTQRVRQPWCRLYSRRTTTRSASRMWPTQVTCKQIIFT